MSNTLFESIIFCCNGFFMWYYSAMFIVTAKGNAVTGTKLKQLEPFEEVFEMNEGRKSYARVIIQSTLIGPRLREKMKGFRTTHTCQVVDIKEKDGKVSKDQSEMETAIVTATDMNCLPSTLDVYARKEGKTQLINESIKKRKIKIEKDKKKKKRSSDEGYID